MEKSIEIKNIGKKYILSHQTGAYITLRESITSAFSRPLRWFSARRNRKEEFWALQDISFSAQPGEIVGIIGANGAGKSTLLKILSQITPPTTGEVRINGRVSSLLEVGTGFHPELTGRENIYLNGAILGMSRKDIERKFKEIVEFAGVEKFLDTPVKHFSSGMFVRLAFSVAAHLEPDILILDEVLAVGDAEFQKKCLGRMEEVTQKEGRTILFVSHNMAAVKKLCSRCVVLQNGRKVFEGATEEAILAYENLQSKQELKINKGEYSNTRRGSGTLSFTELEMLDTNNKKKSIFAIGEVVRFKVAYAVFNELQDLQLHISLYKDRQSGVLTTMKHEVKSTPLQKGEKGSLFVDVPLTTICPGEYNIHFWLGDRLALNQAVPTNFDVVDNMIGPLVVKAVNEKEREMVGYFTLLSNLHILN